MRPIVVLGATGSIGRQTLDVAKHLGATVAGLAARRPSPAFADLVSRYPEAVVAVAEGGQVERGEFLAAIPQRAGFGTEAVLELAKAPERIVVNGIVGSAGLAATLATLEAGNRLALANKESMVAAGELVRRALDAAGGELIPVDSEHSALFQCLDGEHIDDVNRLILTASGGPFRGRRRDDLAGVSPEDALRHPTWDMGGRITVDSATLVNKGMEVIEAHHLFGIDFGRIDVVVHPQSIVHSAVEFVDGALKAHVGHPDMRIPIQYSLTYPRRGPAPGEPFDLARVGLEFETVDRAAFPALDLAYDVGKRGGSAPAVLNAADEIAVKAFLEGRIPFLAITDVVEATVDKVPWVPLTTLADVMAVDGEARAVASAQVKNSSE
ncbi:MAG: 1-deoxy-D-xylulose-5-phosphate reductoisomerase [Acidimicrobiia bacterium]